MAELIIKLTNVLPMLPRHLVPCVMLCLRTGISPSAPSGEYTRPVFYLWIRVLDSIRIYYQLLDSKPKQVEWPHPAPDGVMCREFKEAETHVPSACGDRELL